MNLSKSPLIIFAILATCHGEFARSEEPCDSNARKKSGFVTGYGEASQYNEAKSDAIADLAGFFKTVVHSSVALSESSENANISAETVSTIDGAIKGAEVLSECRTKDQVRITVGVRKSRIQSSLTLRANDRKEWVDSYLSQSKNRKSSDLSGHQGVELKNMIRDERSDREVWILLGISSEMFPAVPAKSIQEINQMLSYTQKDGSGQPIRISPLGQIAEATIGQLVPTLKDLGYNVSIAKKGEENVATFDCLITKGSKMGNIFRFSVRCNCSLSNDKNLEPIKADGIADDDRLNDTAIRLVNEAISRRGSTDSE